jgi:hypothetical protein
VSGRRSRVGIRRCRRRRPPAVPHAPMAGLSPAPLWVRHGGHGWPVPPSWPAAAAVCRVVAATGIGQPGICLLDHIRCACVIAPGGRSAPGCIRYPDDGGLTAGRARRQRVRLQAAGMFEQDVSPVQVAHRLRVSTKPASQWRRRWCAGCRAALASKGAGGAVCRLNDGQVARLRAALEGGPAAWGWDQDQRWTLARSGGRHSLAVAVNPGPTARPGRR